MLNRHLDLIHGVATQSEIAIQYQEVTHIQSNFSLMATVSALLAGFEFTVFGLEAEAVGEYSQIHASSIAYMVVASLSLGVNMVSLSNGSVSRNCCCVCPDCGVHLDPLRDAWPWTRFARPQG